VQAQFLARDAGKCACSDGGTLPSRHFVGSMHQRLSGPDPDFSEKIALTPNLRWNAGNKKRQSLGSAF
jgi:hypothetical protein